jgi:hypothetical protein
MNECPDRPGGGRWREGLGRGSQSGLDWGGARPQGRGKAGTEQGQALGAVPFRGHQGLRDSRIATGCWRKSGN